MADKDFLVRFELDVSQAVVQANALSRALGRVAAGLQAVDAAAGKAQAGINTATAAAGAAGAAAGKTAAASTKASKAITTLNGNTYANAKALQVASKQNALYNQYLHDQERGQRRMVQGLSTTRYALYDVASTLGMTGAALLAIPVAAVAAAISFERNFANVRRTSEVTGRAAAELQNDLIMLSRTMPSTFKEITEIATLGGQLGIAANELDKFTSVVARLDATTDLTAEAAGTMLGRFQALLDVSGDEFENLASAILKVGVNSVATETQIVNISTQISSMADFAGFTAEQVVGLAGALASVGAAPELARGTVTRTFSLMARAVSEGGAKLEAFAQTSGTTSKDFAAAFGTSRFAPIFQNFLKGLQGIEDQGGNVVTVLNKMGISSVRDVPLLLRLAGAQDVVTRSFADAASGWMQATELQKQYGIIAETTAARLEILVNNIMALFNTLGSQATGPINAIVRGLTEFVSFLNDMASTELGQRIMAVALGLSAFLGAIMLLLAGAAVAGAGMIALRQGVVGLSAILGPATVQTGVLARMMTNLGVSTTGAATASRLLSSALKGIGIAAAFLFLPDITKMVDDWWRSVRGIDVNDVQGTLGRISESVRSFNDTMEKTGRDLGSAGAKGMFGFMGEDAQILDEKLASLAQSGNIERVNTAMKSLSNITGLKRSELIDQMPELKAALTEVANTSPEAERALQGLASAEEEAAIRAERVAASIGILPEEMKAFTEAVQKGSEGFFNYGDMIQRVQDQTRAFAEKESRKVYGAADSWQEFYDGSSVNIHKFMDVLDQQIANQQTWAGDVQELAARGATGFAAELARMGPESAPLAAAAVNMTADELMKLEEQARLAAFLASEAFANTLVDDIPMLVKAYEAGGIEAVRGMISAQQEEARTGVPGAVQTFVDTWNANYNNKPIIMDANMNTEPAQRQLYDFKNRNGSHVVSMKLVVDTFYADGLMQNFIGRWRNQSITVRGNIQTNQIARAQGGPVYGPGTSTSDSIPARLSHGEFVIRAASVRKYGTGFFDALNRGVARFANGGHVGTHSTIPASSAGAGTIVNATVIQNYPTTRDPIKRLKQDAEDVVTGIWS